MNIPCLLIVVTGVVIHVALGNSTNPSKFEQFLYDRCKSHSSEAATFDKTKEHLNGFSDIFSYAIGLLPEGKKQFCNDERSRLTNLMGAVSQDVKSCLPKEEQYLPRFVSDSFTEFLRFLCVNGGRNIDNFFSTQGKECRDNLKRGQAGQDVELCFKKAFNTFSSRVMKDDLCYDLKSARNCFGEQISKHCPGFKAFGTLSDNFFESVSKPCILSSPNSAVMIGSQGLVLTIGAVLFTKYFS